MRYLVVDISTTAQPGIEESPYISWASKKGATTLEDARSKAGLHAEYGMICGLSAYWVNLSSDDFEIKEAMTESANTIQQEEALLNKFDRITSGTNICLVGHNVQDFTIPFMTKRFLGNGIIIPEVLREAIHKKKFIDTMKELSCGGVSVMSLRSAAWMLGIDDPRSKVSQPKFYQLCVEGKMNRVAELTRMNAQTAAKVFGFCSLGKLFNF